ncbi:unnamed protein product, partial [Mesorhabditis belari]|uniref:Uncharacterized protein n=1 Tax=Mesorhabditis belari TaxID=2138241 RepID=A0AAF3FEL6_9BILA
MTSSIASPNIPFDSYGCDIQEMLLEFTNEHLKTCLENVAIEKSHSPFEKVDVDVNEQSSSSNSFDESNDLPPLSQEEQYFDSISISDTIQEAKDSSRYFFDARSFSTETNDSEVFMESESNNDFSVEILRHADSDGCTLWVITADEILSENAEPVELSVQASPDSQSLNASLFPIVNIISHGLRKESPVDFSVFFPENQNSYSTFPKERGVQYRPVSVAIPLDATGSG